LCQCGSTIKVIKLEASEYGLEEDEYADYEYYLELEREQAREDKMWEEEYYTRRRDPYWKNDSDYIYICSDEFLRMTKMTP